MSDSGIAVERHPEDPRARRQKGKNMRLRLCVVAVLTVLGCGPSALAAVKLPAVFSDDMVLQRDRAVPVWGWADAGEKVTVTLNGRSESATADARGRWRVHLPAQPAGGPCEMTVAGTNTLSFRNVLLGDVWVCSGQSNMEMGVGRCANPAAEIANSDHPKIRLFIVSRLLLGGEPREDCVGRWAVCGPKTVRDLSGVGYAFGRELHRTLGVPIGLIHACRGSTPITSWISREALQTVPETAPLLRRYDAIDAQLPELLARYQKDVAAWNEAKAAGTPPNKLGPYPAEPGPEKDMYHPSGVYNGQVHPLMPFAIKGVIWYHGEADIGVAPLYARLFPLLINDWRAHWGQGDFPFLFVQLANFGDPRPQPGESNFANLREAQALALSLPGTAMAVAIDAGARDFFPTNKQPVADRLALAARAVAYGEKIECSGPVFDRMQVEGAKAVISFQHVGGGLTIKGDALAGFAVAGADGKFVRADAIIEGDTVAVSSALVPRPAAVRYAWADNPECNLYNRAGLPAAPFRTDRAVTSRP